LKTSNEIRKEFLKFFEGHDHKIVPSASVIPYDDPTLLFTNAGMNQFKDVFLGTGKREYKRAADTQKCIRVSGKHNDLEEVGRDTYHHTFFEMLGNWSFGDYYKKEAIDWAWELLTKVWGLDKKRLYATVYESDDEAEELWKKVTDIDPAHVLRFGKKDNFWEMGETGPCGPCSEIHIDLSEKSDCGHLVNVGDARVMEIWNLVFIQYNRDEKGTLTPLPAKHVDTGMGFERICAVLQGKKSNYETDVFLPIINYISEVVGRKYSHTDGTNFIDPLDEFAVAMRVIADHIRMLTFSIADGGTFSNEKRGYVMRKILRRASLFGKTLHMDTPFLYKIVEAVVATMGHQFPEIKEKQMLIENTIKKEEETFLKTLSKGVERFYRYIIGERIKQLYIQHNKIQNNWWVDTNLVPLYLILRDLSATKEEKIELKSDIQDRLGIDLSISGDDAFELHDTHGIPFDLTAMWAEDLGININTKRFDELMDEQRSRSRISRNIADAVPPITDTIQLTSIRGKESAKKLDTSSFNNKFKFVGYNYFESDAEVLDISDNLIILNMTPFYAESGGQIGDQGIIEVNNEKFEVCDTQKSGDVHVHIMKYPIKISRSGKARAYVDKDRRMSIMRNHTATHLLHEALRTVLGEHLHQQGSLVAPDRLRFDFNHFEKITPDQIRKIEDIVNEKISQALPVTALNDPNEWLTIEEAKRQFPKLKMFFGEKYGDKVRVVAVKDFCAELCGGTHVKNTSDIRQFKIVSESSIASGIRRIEAVTGDGIKQFINEQLEKIGEIDNHISKLLVERETLEKELGQYKKVEPLKRPSLGAIKIQDGNATTKTIDEIEALIQERQNATELVNKEISDIKKELSKHRVQEASTGIDALVASGVVLDGFKIVSGKIEASSMDELKNIGDTLRAKLTSGVGVLGAVIDEKVALVCVVTDDLIKNKKLQAGKIVGEIAKLVGGGGGGRPHLATAGGKDIEKLDKALEKTVEIIKSMIT
jgi:alanyl-tRNA synthetase